MAGEPVAHRQLGLRILVPDEAQGGPGLVGQDGQDALGSRVEGPPTAREHERAQGAVAGAQRDGEQGLRARAALVRRLPSYAERPESERQAAPETARPEPRHDPEPNREKRHRIAVDRVEKVQHALVPELRTADPGGQLRIGGVGERKAVIDHREERPQERRRKPQHGSAQPANAINDVTLKMRTRHGGKLLRRRLVAAMRTAHNENRRE